MPEVLQQIVELFNTFIVAEITGKTGMIMRASVYEKDFVILILQRDSKGGFKSSVLHEIIHYLGFRNFLPFDGNSEIITQAVGTFGRLRENALEDLESSELSILRLITQARDDYHQKRALPNPKDLVIFIENFLKRALTEKDIDGYSNFCHNYTQEKYLDILQRCCGIYLGGYAFAHEKETGDNGLKFIVDYGKAHLPRVRNADLTRKVTRRDRVFIRDVLDSIGPSARAALPDLELTFGPGRARTSSVIRKRGVGFMSGQDTGCIIYLGIFSVY